MNDIPRCIQDADAFHLGNDAFEVGEVSVDFAGG